MLTTRDNEQAILRAFNSLAVSYDAVFESGEITRTVRDYIQTLVETLVSPTSRILDINCGTGTDAIALAARGHSVVGIDISPLMIQQARQKSSGLSRVQFLEGTYRYLDRLQVDNFDLVLSNFGGLNCTSDLAGLGAQVARVLKPAGLFVAVVMPPISIWDVTAKAVRGQFSTAARRAFTGKATAAFEGESFQVYYHAPAELTNALQPLLRRTDLFGLNVFSPPPHARRFAESYPRLSHTLARLDHLIRRFPVLRSLGDHYVAVFQKAAD